MKNLFSYGFSICFMKQACDAVKKTLIGIDFTQILPFLNLESILTEFEKYKKRLIKKIIKKRASL